MNSKDKYERLSQALKKNLKKSKLEEIAFLMDYHHSVMMLEFQMNLKFLQMLILK